MATRAEVVACARAYTGCPYKHQGRIRAGIDCIGLAIAACSDLELGEFDFQAYSREPDGVTLVAEIEKVCGAPVQQYQPGDLLIFKIRRWPQHVGIVTDLGDGLGLIHAYQSIGKVAEHVLTDWWIERIIGAYRLPGVED